MHKLKAYWQRLRQLQCRISTATNCWQLAAAARPAGRRRRGENHRVRRQASLIFHPPNCDCSYREGRYLLRTNLSADDGPVSGAATCSWCLWRKPSAPSKAIWACAFPSTITPERLKRTCWRPGLLFYITLRQRLKALAGGLMPRVVFENRPPCTRTCACPRPTLPRTAPGAPHRTKPTSPCWHG